MPESKSQSVVKKSKGKSKKEQPVLRSQWRDICVGAFLYKKEKSKKVASFHALCELLNTRRDPMSRRFRDLVSYVIEKGEYEGWMRWVEFPRRGYTFSYINTDYRKDIDYFLEQTKKLVSFVNKNKSVTIKDSIAFIKSLDVDFSDDSEENIEAEVSHQLSLAYMLGQVDVDWESEELRYITLKPKDE